MAEKILDIGQLRASVAGRIRLEDGSEHDVLQTRSRMYHDLRASKKEDAVALVFKTVAEIVPTATAVQVGELTLEQANAILALAGAGIEAVEQLYPNAVSPAASTSPG